MSAKDTTDTLKIGDRAPDFTLSAANSGDSTNLQALLKRGPVIVEFLRGTW